MKKLSSDQLKTKLALEKDLEAAKNTLDEALEKYNALVADAESLRDDVLSSIQDFCGDKSEKWQESEKGQNYAQWAGLWEDQFDQVDELDLDHHDRLCNLPEDIDSL
jgi:hypothetical protein